MSVLAERSAVHGAVTRSGPRRLTPGVAGRRGAVVLLALVWLVIVAAPVYYMFVVSLQPAADFLSGGNPWVPAGGITADNYAAVFGSGFWRYLRNSLVVAFGSTALAIGVGILAAFAIVMHPSKATGLVFRVFLGGFAVPIQALMIPLYIEVQRLRLYDSLWGLVLPMAAFALPITVFILVNFLRDVPRSLVEAMEIDGAGRMRILVSLTAPLAMPAIVTVAIFDLIQSWNNFLFPLILTQSSDISTLPLAVFNFQGRNFANVPNIMASVFLATAPLLIFYLVARRRIVEALTAGFGR